MKLTKKGIETQEWIPTDFEGEKGRYEDIIHFLKEPNELLRYWNATLEEIEPGYTLGDFFTLLDELDELAVFIVGWLCDLDLEAFLEESHDPPEEGEPSDIDFLHVTNSAEVTRYDPDPNNPDEPMGYMTEEEAEEDDRLREGIADITGGKKRMALVDSTGDDPITGLPVSRRMRLGTMNGKWVGPYHISRDFGGWGKWDEPYAIEKEGWDPEMRGGISISFVKLPQLLKYELRYDPAIEFWTGPSEGNPRGTLRFKDTLTITFGEFVRAVLWEIGWNGSPAKRDARKDELDERTSKLKEELGE